MRLISDQKKFKLGLWAGLLGVIMLLLSAFLYLLDFRFLYNFNILFLLPIIFTFLWGIIALIGVIFVYRDNENGDFMLIYSGVLAIFGTFFPMIRIEFESFVFLIYLSYTFGYIDPFLILFGGIIDLLVRKEIIWS